MQRIIHSIAVQRGTFAASMVITNRPIGFMDPVSYNKEIGNFGRTRKLPKYGRELKIAES